MRRTLMLTCALVVTCTVPARSAPMAPPPVSIKWQTAGTTLAVADLDGSPGLELVLGGTFSGRIEIIEPQGGTAAYQLPLNYGDGSGASVLVENFDGTGANEVMVWYRDPGTATRFGMFWWNGAAYVPRWQVTEGIPADAELSSVDIVGNGIRHVVALTGQRLRIFDALNGIELYDSSNDAPQLQFASVAASDIDGDLIEELVAEGTVAGNPMTVVIETIQTAGAEPVAVTRGTLLRQNAPNPFRGPTRIAFTVPRSGHVTLHVYDVAGRLVRGLLDESRAAGPHEVAWDGRDAAGRVAPSGSYFCEIDVDGARQSRRMVRMD